MKNSMRSLAAIVATVIAVQAPLASFSIAEASARNVSLSAQAATTATIAKAMATFTRDKKNMPVEQAAQKMVLTLSETDVSKDDIMNFVAQYSTPEQAAQAAKNIDHALEGVPTEMLSQMSEAQQAQLLGNAFKAVQADKLNWSGCHTMGVGIALTLAAVIIAAVSIGKMRGEKWLAKDFDKKRASRTSQYNTARDNINNRPANIQSSIVNYGNKIDAANTEIARQQGLLQAAIIYGDTYGAQLALDAITAQQSLIAGYNDSITTLNAELMLYNDPAYAQGRLADLEIDYNAAMANLNQEEANRINMIPEEQKAGKAMLIGGSIGAVLGTFMIVGGSNGC